MEYTDEQKKAIAEYDDLCNRWRETAINLLFLKRFTEAELSEIDGTAYEYPHNFESLEDVRKQMNQKRKECIDLKINIL